MTHAAAVKKAETMAHMRVAGFGTYVVLETRDTWDYWSEGSNSDYWGAVGELQSVRTDIVVELLELDYRAAQMVRHDVARAWGCGRWRDLVRASLREVAA